MPHIESAEPAELNTMTPRVSDPAIIYEAGELVPPPAPKPRRTTRPAPEPIDTDAPPAHLNPWLHDDIPDPHTNTSPGSHTSQPGRPDPTDPNNQPSHLTGTSNHSTPNHPARTQHHPTPIGDNATQGTFHEIERRLYMAIKHKRAAQEFRRNGRSSSATAKAMGVHIATVSTWASSEQWHLWCDAADAIGVEQAVAVLEEREEMCRGLAARNAQIMLQNAIDLNLLAAEYKRHPEKYGRVYGKDAQGFESKGRPTIPEIAAYSRAAQENANKLFGWDSITVRAGEGVSSPADEVQREVMALLQQAQTTTPKAVVKAVDATLALPSADLTAA